MPRNPQIPERVTRRAYEGWVPGEGECRLSVYSTTGRRNSQVGWRTPEGRHQKTSAHRAAWTHVHGEIPDGMVVIPLPTCDLRCVNVEDHLKLVSHYHSPIGGRRD